MNLPVNVWLLLALPGVVLPFALFQLLRKQASHPRPSGGPARLIVAAMSYVLLLSELSAPETIGRFHTNERDVIIIVNIVAMATLFMLGLFAKWRSDVATTLGSACLAACWLYAGAIGSVV